MGTFLILVVVFIVAWIWSESFFMALIISGVLAFALDVDVDKAKVIVVSAYTELEQLADETAETRKQEAVEKFTKEQEGVEVKGGVHISVELNPDKHYTPGGLEHYTGKDRLQIRPSSIAKRMELEPRGIRDRLRKSEQVDVFWTDKGIFQACEDDGLGPCFDNPEFLMHDSGVVYACKPNSISCYVVRGNDG